MQSLIFVRGLALTLALSSLATANAAAQPTTVGLVAECGGERRRGVGFLATYRNERVIVTALHVVTNCAYVEVYAIAQDCLGGALPSGLPTPPRIGSGSTWHTWPAYDLAAVPVSQASAGVQELVAGGAAPALAGRRPAPYERIVIHGPTRSSPCPSPATSGGLVRIAEQIEHLRRTGVIQGGTVSQHLGYLGSSTTALLYHALVTPGTSGAPIVTESGNRLIAVHHGGSTSDPLGWGILLPATLPDPTPLPLGGHGWNTNIPYSVQSDTLVTAEQLVERERAGQSTDRVRVSLAFLTRPLVAQDDAVWSYPSLRTEVLVAYSGELGWLGDEPSAAWRGYLGGGIAYTYAQGSYSLADGTPVEDRVSEALDLWGEAALGLSGSRDGAVRTGVDVGAYLGLSVPLADSRAYELLRTGAVLRIQVTQGVTQASTRFGAEFILRAGWAAAPVRHYSGLPNVLVSAESGAFTMELGLGLVID